MDVTVHWTLQVGAGRPWVTEGGGGVPVGMGTGGIHKKLEYKYKNGDEFFFFCIFYF